MNKKTWYKRIIISSVILMASIFTIIIPLTVKAANYGLYSEENEAEVEYYLVEELERVEARPVGIEGTILHEVTADFMQRILIIIVLLVLVVIVILLSTRRENAIGQSLRRKSVYKMGLFFLPLIVALGSVILFGNSPRGIGYLIGGMFIFIVLLPIIKNQWEDISKSEYMKDIKEFVDQSSDPWKMMKRLEYTWKKGEKVTNSCRVDDEFLIFGDGTLSGVVPWEEVEKIEMRWDVIRGHRNLQYQRIGLRVYLKDDEIRSFFMGMKRFEFNRPSEHFEKITKKLFDHVAKHHPSIVLDKVKDGRTDRSPDS